MKSSDITDCLSPTTAEGSGNVSSPNTHKNCESISSDIYREAKLDCIDYGRTISEKVGFNFYQTCLSRKLPRGDFYMLWHRLDRGEETFLAVIWHENWKNRRASDISTDPNSIEQWVINSLLRIHHRKPTIDAIREDFHITVSDPHF